MMLHNITDVNQETKTEKSRNTNNNKLDFGL